MTSQGSFWFISVFRRLLWIELRYRVEKGTIVIVLSSRIDWYFLNKFCPNLLNGGIHKDRAPAKQSLLRWPCPLPSDRAIPVVWQNLESNVYVRTWPRTAGPLTEFAWLRPVANRNHTRQEADKYQAPVAPRTPDLFHRDACSHHAESNALPTELRDRQYAISVDTGAGRQAETRDNSWVVSWRSGSGAEASKRVGEDGTAAPHRSAGTARPCHPLVHEPLLTSLFLYESLVKWTSAYEL